MIKLEKDWKVETDCKTVGEFMTEAATFEFSVKVSIDDNNNYFFEGGQKVKVVDDTPIDKVLFDRTDYTLNARASFRVFTKPKPKTVKKSGWVNIYKCDVGRTTGRIIFETETAAKLARSLEGLKKVDTVCVEWEEVQQ